VGLQFRDVKHSYVFHNSPIQMKAADPGDRIAVSDWEPSPRWACTRNPIAGRVAGGKISRVRTVETIVLRQPELTGEAIRLAASSAPPCHPGAHGSRRRYQPGAPR